MILNSIDERGHSMLFRKKLPRSCSYCAWGTRVGEEQVLCTKRGVVSLYYACRKFDYDPCKRIPMKAKALDLGKYRDEDFSL